MLLHATFLTKQKIATLLGTSFSTDENAMAQAVVQLLGKTVESFVTEFDQEKFEKFLSSGSPVPRQCGTNAKSLLRLAFESLRRLPLKLPAPLLTMQRAPLLKRFWKPLVSPCCPHQRLMLPASTSFKRPAEQKRWRTIKEMVKTNSSILLLSKLCNSRLSGVPNNLYGLTVMLNVDEGVAHVDNRLKIL